ncbi:choice-of-anchor U domain-containing protein [Shewanella sp. 10N.286.52.A9]|uniref:beta strand repeat-containing protein n=1 Tax=Shewanella sp. 10N.286.52.A9 TaxID=3229711 RepID=UPI00354F545D
MQFKLSLLLTTFFGVISLTSPVKASGIDSDDDGVADAVDVDIDGNGLIEINSLEQFNNIRNNLAGTAYDNGISENTTGCGNNDDIIACFGYELTTNLDFDENDDGVKNDTYNTGEGWTPIGTLAAPFTGTFDGNHFTIANLYINNTSLTGDDDSLGLFGHAENTTIENLHVNGQVTASGYYVAGLVGYIYGSSPSVMTNISFTGTVESNQAGAYAGGIAARASQATVKQCLATVDVTGQGDAGAFAGELVNGSVENCLVNGSVITSGTVGGGFIGNLSSADVTNVASHARAEANNAVGGLIGSVASSSSTITNSFSTGSAKQAFNKGGLTGSALGTVTDSYWDTQASGNASSGSGTGYTTTELQAPVTNAGIYANWDEAYWDFGTSSQYPSPIINGVAFHDRDNDGVPDSLDAFPDDAAEWADTDNDNVGDNADAFPNDPTEWSDADGDLIGDNSDPDADNDGVANESDLYPFDETGSTAAHDVDIDDDGLIEISTLAQLHAMRDDLAGNSLSGVTAGCAGLTDGTGCIGYELTTDLDFDTDSDGDLSDETYYNAGEGWQPIGTSDDRFAANFNGNGFTIHNLFINRPDEDYQALLGYVATVSVTNINIDGDLTSVTGLNNSAFLIARNSSDDSAVLSNINVQGTILGNDDSGLVAGRLYNLDADQVHAQGNITSISITDDAGSDTGGLFGQLSGTNTLDNVSFEGDIQAVTSAGGLIGDAESVTINDSYAIVDITLIDEAGIETDIEVAGGLIGKVEGTSVLTRVFAQGNITAPKILGGLIGDIDGATEVVDSYADVSLLGDSIIGGIAGDLNADSTFERVLAYGAINTNDDQNTDTGGLLGYSASNTLSVVYALWDTEATGISSTFNNSGAGYTSEELQCPTTPVDVNCNSTAYTNDWSSANWDFGTSEQYPALLLSGNLYRDADADGYWAFEDAFDDDATEYLDSDSDGVGDNADAFPNDRNEQYDTDGDGVGNNADNDDAGDLVTTYGLNGIASAYVHNGDREIYITDAIAHDNGLYLVGSAYYDAHTDDSGVIIDVDSTGEINTDFAESGVLYALNQGLATHFKLALTNEIGIKVAGDKDNQVFIAQYDATGALDTRFNETGVYDNEDGLIIRGTDVASTLSDGSTVIYGKYTYQNFAHKLSSDGTFDTNFGDAGNLSVGTTELGSSVYFIDALVLDDDSQVLAMQKQDRTFYLTKIDVDGNIDTSFGTDGELALDSDMFARSIKLAKDAEGNVYAAGTTSNVAKRLSVLKIVDGQLDSTFADNGYSANDFDEDVSVWNVQDIQIQRDGRILILSGVTADYAHVVRFTENGELDSQFNTVGYVRLDVQDYDPIKLIVQDDGNLLIAGSDWNGFGIHLVNMLNDYDLDGDGLTNSNDRDDDADGVEDISDAFPLDPTETLDSDNDGVGDNADAFPNDASETVDTDNDGVGDNTDAFPNDASETVDSDNDGVGNNADAFPNDASETVDSDNDGVGDNADAFPNDASETLDTDNDGVGDNADAFPNDASETLDSDNDGVGDNADAFPTDPTETLDTDNDGIGNNADNDDDGDGVIDANDPNPLDPNDSDTQAPVISHVESMTFEATGELTQVQVPQPSVMDDNDASPELTVDTDNFTFSLGEHVITWTATDMSGNHSSAEQVITIVDTTAPSFDDLIDMSINAQGRLTNIANLVSLSATDLVDGDISVNIMGDTLLTSGSHIVEVEATDALGNMAVSSFNLDIVPMLTLPSQRPVEAGGEYTINAYLNGEAANYPVQISYSLLVNGFVNNQLVADIEAGQVGQLDIAIPESVTNEDQLQLQLDYGVNAFIGDANITELTLIERNVAPRMNLTLRQNGRVISVIDANNGMVTITANVRDINQNDTHNLTWSSIDGLVDAAIDENLMTFEIDPSLLQSGVYQVNAIATETNTSDVFSVSRTAQLVIADLPTLGSDVDSDNDGIPDSDEGYADSDGDGIADYLDNDANDTRLPTQNDAEPAHTEDGLSMTLGLFVSRLGITADSASFSIEDLIALLQAGDADPQDSYFETITPVYNFIVNGLSEQGESVAVVIPLAEGQTLPADAIYRKYNPSLGWYSFVVDANNNISSALADENGNCPLVNDATYAQASAQGLVEGNNCIRLLIEDGGPNDIDGLANGSIEDPGVVTVQTGTPPVNTAPSLVLESHNNEVEENSSITLIAVGSDAEDDSLSYQWQQLSGPAVLLENQTTNQLTLTTPEVSNDEVIEVQVTVSDGELSYSVTTSLTVTNKTEVETEEPTQPEPEPESNSNSGGAFGIWFMLLMLIGFSRRRYK